MCVAAVSTSDFWLFIFIAKLIPVSCLQGQSDSKWKAAQ